MKKISSLESYFVDTSFVQALLDKNDQHYNWAIASSPFGQRRKPSVDHRSSLC